MMKQNICMIVVGVLMVTGPIAWGQKNNAQEGEPAGGSLAVKGQYKRVHQELLRMILEGDDTKALKELEKIAAKAPDDMETHFLLAIVHEKQGGLDQAEAHLLKAVKAGLPVGRIIAGPRPFFRTLLGRPKIKKLLEPLMQKPIHGPMLGTVTDKSARFWVRTDRPALFSIMVSRSRQGKKVMRSKVVKTSAESDFTAVVQVDGLEADTVYYYDAYIDYGYLDRGFKAVEGQQFRTHPKTGSKSKYTIAFGGGAGYVPHHEYAWNTVGKFKPRALLLLGDNIYSDDPKSPAMQKYCYYRRQSRAEFRKLVARTPVYAIWDDHDFATNDSSGGPDIESPTWKRQVWQVFKQNWVNPYYGGGESQPGCWFDFYIGDVHFIMTDGRYYRTEPKKTPVQERSMLGPAQKKWLFQTIKNSKGTFKILVSGVPWTPGTKGGSQDTWDGFAKERKEIFDFLSANKVEGVVLLSADRHRSDAWKIPRAGGYDLYEFESSRLTNQHVHKTMPKALFSYNGHSFGLIDIDTTLSDPELTYRIATIQGKIVYTLTLKRSQLLHP